MTTKVLLIDAFNIIRRIFEAAPDASDHIEDVIQSSARSLARALKQHPSTHVCMVFDSHEPTWRHLLYSEYKAGRKPTPSALLDNLLRFESAFKKLGVKSLTIDTYEADDVIASFAVGLAEKDAKVTILSTDKGFLQLLCPNISVFNHFDQVDLGEAVVLEKYAVKVDQLTDYWALAGDASNNIKGVPKVGKKTASNLLTQYDSLEAILSDEEAVSSALRVQSAGDLAQSCKQLVTLKTDVPLGINLKDFRLMG